MDGFDDERKIEIKKDKLDEVLEGFADEPATTTFSQSKGWE